MKLFTQIMERIQDFNTGAGIVTNLLLLYVIKRFSSVELGTYKYLITVFSINDICLTLLHMVLRPKNIIMGTVFSLVADGPVESKHLAAIYSACFTIPFSLMCYHFIYRYWAIKSPYKCELFTRTRFVTAIVLHILIQSFLWYLLVLLGTTGHDEDEALQEVRQKFEETFDKRIEHGWRNDEFQLRPALVVLILDTVSSVQIVFSLWLAYKTFRAIQASSTISSHTRRFHAQVLVTLSAQTQIPLIFVFLPYFCSITLPLIKLSFAVLSPICIPLISFFPSWDALIVVFLIKDYRKGVREMLSSLNPFSSSTVTKVIRIDSIGRGTNTARASESGVSTASKS